MGFEAGRRAFPPAYERIPNADNPLGPSDAKRGKRGLYASVVVRRLIAWVDESQSSSGFWRRQGRYTDKSVPKVHVGPGLVGKRAAQVLNFPGMELHKVQGVAWARKGGRKGGGPGVSAPIRVHPAANIQVRGNGLRRQDRMFKGPYDSRGRFSRFLG